MMKEDATVPWKIALGAVSAVALGVLIWAIVMTVQRSDLLPKPLPEIPDIAGFEYEEVFRKGPADGSFFYPATSIRGARMPGTNYNSLFIAQQNGTFHTTLSLSRLFLTQ